MFDENKDTMFSDSADFEASVSGVENVTKKRRGKKIAIISGATAAVFIGGGVAAYNFSPLVKNQVKLRVMKPDNYYAWVNDENAQSLAGKLSSRYADGLERYENGVHSNISLEFELSDYSREQLCASIFDEDYAELDSAHKQLYDYVSKINSAKVSLDSKSKAGNKALSLAGIVNDEQLLSLECFADLSDMGFYARVPELTEQWLGISLCDTLLGENSQNEALETLKNIINNPREFLSPDELETEIQRYVDVWNDVADDVELEKNEKVSIGDIEVKYTIATVELDSELMEKAEKAFAESAKEDELLREIFVERTGLMDNDEYDEMFEDTDDDTESDEDVNEFIGEEESDDRSLSVSTFIDAKGEIRGIEIKENDEDSFKVIVGKDGKDVCGEMISISGGETRFEASLDAKETGKDEYSGEITFTDYSSEYDFETDEYKDTESEYTIEFDDFKIENEETLYFDADVTFTNPKGEKYDIEFDGDDDSQSIIFEVVIDEKDYGKLILAWSTEEGVDIDKPNKEESFMINADSDFSLEDYVSKDKAESFIRDLLKKIGINEEDSASIASEAYDELLNDSEEIASEIEYE